MPKPLSLSWVPKVTTWVGVVVEAETSQMPEVVQANSRFEAPLFVETAQ